MQGIIRLSNQRRFRVAALSVLALVALLLVFGQLTTFAAISASNSTTGENLSSSLNAAPQQASGCKEGWKIDDLHYGLPGWTIHARLANGANATEYTQVTDGNGYFKFDDLPEGTYLFWEEMQTGWAPVTNPQFTSPVVAGDICDGVYHIEQGDIRFKNKQATPTVTPSTEGTRIHGIVYDLTCEGLVPMPDVLLETWRSEFPNDLDFLYQDKYSQADGSFHFVLLPPYPNYDHTLVFPPAGYIAIAALAPEGVVVAPDHIRFDHPGWEWFDDNVFILQEEDLICDPTPTPTDTPTPTLTPTPTHTPTPSPPKLYLPLILRRPSECVAGKVHVIVWGEHFSFPLTPDGNVKSIAPLPWGFPTTFWTTNYTGPIKWTQYQPFYNKQVGGYTFIYPGGYAGHEFSLFVATDCGKLAIETEIDDPTPTPTPADPTSTPVATSTPVPTEGWQTILDDDLNGDLSEWLAEGDPTWGQTECRSHSAPASAWPAAAGTGAATACTDNYPNNLNSWLLYGPFDLSDATAAEVTFDFWLDSEKDYDHLKWLASTDNRAFYGFKQSGNSNGWTSRTFDLSDVYQLGDLRGESQVWFAFIFESDDSRGDVGAFVDDVTIRKYVGGSPEQAAPNQAQADNASLQPATQTR